MKKEDETYKLEATISMLETILEAEEVQLKEQFTQSLQDFHPINLIKDGMSKLANEPEFKDDLIDTSISLISGYFSKKLLFGSSKNPTKQALGSLLQMGITALASKYIEPLRVFTTSFIADLFPKKEESKEP